MEIRIWIGRFSYREFSAEESKEWRETVQVLRHTRIVSWRVARVCGYTRVSGVLEGVGGQRPIGSKHSLSERVSWTHASRTRRGLGLPLLERSELSFFLSLFPPFFPFFFTAVAFYRPYYYYCHAILICLEFAFHASTTTCTGYTRVEVSSKWCLFYILSLICKISRVFFFFLVKIYLFFKRIDVYRESMHSYVV